MLTKKLNLYFFALIIIFFIISEENCFFEVFNEYDRNEISATCTATGYSCLKLCFLLVFLDEAREVSFTIAKRVQMQNLKLERKKLENTSLGKNFLHRMIENKTSPISSFDINSRSNVKSRVQKLVILSHNYFGMNKVFTNVAVKF